MKQKTKPKIIDFTKIVYDCILGYIISINIAGIINKNKNVLGMMPHPERMIDKYLSGEDGSLFFENLLGNLN